MMWDSSFKNFSISSGSDIISEEDWLGLASETKILFYSIKVCAEQRTNVIVLGWCMRVMNTRKTPPVKILYKKAKAKLC